MENCPWVAHGIKQGLVQASQQHRVFQRQGEEGRGERLLRDCSHLVKQSIRMGPSSHSPGLGRPCRTRLAFILHLRGWKRLGSRAAFQVGQHSYYSPSGTDATLAVTEAEFSRAKSQRKAARVTVSCSLQKSGKEQFAVNWGNRSAFSLGFGQNDCYLGFHTSRRNAFFLLILDGGTRHSSSMHVRKTLSKYQK